MDKEINLEELKASAEQGNAAAQWQLGSMYQDGILVEKDVATAVHWYRLAACQGIHEAQYRLGKMYSLGLGVAQDLTTAYMWFYLSAIDGVAGSFFQTNKMQQSLSLKPAEIVEAVRRARACLDSNFKDSGDSTQAPS